MKVKMKDPEDLWKLLRSSTVGDIAIEDCAESLIYIVEFLNWSMKDMAEDTFSDEEIRQLSEKFDELKTHVEGLKFVYLEAK